MEKAAFSHTPNNTTFLGILQLSFFCFSSFVFVFLQPKKANASNAILFENLIFEIPTIFGKHSVALQMAPKHYKTVENKQKHLAPDIDATLGPEIDSKNQILDQILTLQLTHTHTYIYIHTYIHTHMPET